MLENGHVTSHVIISVHFPIVTVLITWIIPHMILVCNDSAIWMVYINQLQVCSIGAIKFLLVL